MKKSYIYGLWVVLYALCFGLAFVPSLGFKQTILFTCGFLFFLPLYYLAWVAHKQADRKTLLELRIISLTAIVLFILVYVLAVVVVISTGKEYPVLNVLTQLFTMPLVCIQSEFVTLLMWACLLIISFRKVPEQ